MQRAVEVLSARSDPIAAPLRMNSGIESSVIEAISSYTFWVMVSTEAAGMNAIMNRVATAPSANAIGIPENITSSVEAPYRRPIERTLMARR
jgi:hypothetical protein